MDNHKTLAERLSVSEIATWKIHNDKPSSDRSRIMVENYSAYSKALYGVDDKTLIEIMPHVSKAIYYHDVKEPQMALQYATKYYDAINIATGLDFNPEDVAQAEINWWVIHDQIEKGGSTYEDLTIAFAKLYSSIFGVEEDILIDACRFKAEATKQHDLAEADDTIDPEIHWNNAEKNLLLFYAKLIETIV